MITEGRPELNSAFDGVDGSAWYAPTLDFNGLQVQVSDSCH